MFTRRIAWVPKLWRRSYLCRRRHKNEYADVVVMPIWARDALLAGVIAA